MAKDKGNPLDGVSNGMKGGWVIWNLKNPKCISAYTGNYCSLVPEEAVDTLGGMERTAEMIAKVGGWEKEDITIRKGDPTIWDGEEKHIYVAERKV